MTVVLFEEGISMSKYISSYYIQEKMRPIENLIKIVNSSIEDKGTNDIASQISDAQKREVAFAFAVIAKELGVQIPDV